MSTAQTYTVALTNFSGPLDLLLSLIEKRQLEITEVSVSQVTGDYLRAVSALEYIDERELMWFLDIATRLLSYKSRALRSLTQISAEQDDETDEATSLADLTEQLRQLQDIRGLARQLGHLYGPALTGNGDTALVVSLPPRNLTLTSLVESWQGVLSRRKQADLPRHEVRIDRLDIAAASQRLFKLLTGKMRTSHLMDERATPRERVEQLLALLEMIKQNLVELMSEGEEHYVRTV